MVDIMTPVTIEAGEYVCRKGEMVDTFYVVTKGEIVLERPCALLVGQCIPHPSLIHPSPNTSEAEQERR